MTEGFRILEHPADLGIEAWGNSLGGALRQGVLALSSVIVDRLTVNATDGRPVSIAASDPEQLIVRLLSEVLFNLDASRFVTSDLRIETISNTHVQGTLLGEELRPTHTMKVDVKAITYHQLSVEEQHGVVRVRVFVDV